MGVMIIVANDLEAQLVDGFIKALHTFGPQSAASREVSSSDFAAVGNQVNAALELNDGYPYIWVCNEIPIPPIPFAEVGEK